MKRNRYRVPGEVMGCLLGMLLPALAVEPVDILDTWDSGTTGWVHGASEATLGCVTNGGVYLNLQFARQSMAAFAEDVVRRELHGVVLTNLSLNFMAGDRAPSAVQLCLHSALSGDEWYLNLPVPPAGGWVAFNVPVDVAEGWFSMVTDNSPEKFFKDLQSVDWVGVYLRRRGVDDEQNYGIDNFHIRGHTIPENLDSNNDGIPDLWEFTYGFNPYLPDNASPDSDGDGANNYAEYRAGTHPRDANSFLQLLDLEDREENAYNIAGVVVRWASMDNRFYSVWRTENLVKGFLRIAEGIPATPPVNEYEDADAVDFPVSFYRIEVEP